MHTTLAHKNLRVDIRPDKSPGVMVVLDQNKVVWLDELRVFALCEAAPFIPESHTSVVGFKDGERVVLRFPWSDGAYQPTPEFMPLSEREIVNFFA